MLRMTGPRVLVQRTANESLRSSVLEVIQLDDTPSNFALVISVGSGRMLANGTRREIPLKEGDRIVCKNFSGADVEIEGKTYTIVEEDDILAIIEP